MTHELKILPFYFKDVATGVKSFELRKDDRNYNIGDKLHLKEWEDEKFTGRHMTRTISYLIRSCPEYGLKDGYVILSMY